MGLLWNILTFPAQGLFDVFEKIAEAVQQELADPEKLTERLLELQIAYEMGEIEQDEYDVAYQALIEKLEGLQE